MEAFIAISAGVTVVTSRGYDEHVLFAGSLNCMFQ